MKSLRNPDRRPDPSGRHAEQGRAARPGDHPGQLAEQSGVSRLTVSQLLHEHRALSPDMAMPLEKLTRQQRRELAEHAGSRRSVGGASAASEVQGDQRLLFRHRHEKPRRPTRTRRKSRSNGYAGHLQMIMRALPMLSQTGLPGMCAPDGPEYVTVDVRQS